MLEAVPGPNYDVGIVYENKSGTRLPVDLSDLSEVRVYDGDSGEPVVEMTSKHPTGNSWF